MVVLNNEPVQKKPKVNQEPSMKKPSANQEPSKEMDQSSFDCYPEIPMKTREVLKTHGIESLFPIQQECFYPLFNGEDLIARDLTGSGKTFAFGLPLIERLRA